MKPRKLNGAFGRIFEECGRRISGEMAIACGNMFITEITLNKTIRYNVKLLIYFFQHSLFEHTGVFANFKNMTYSLNCISVLLYVHSGFTLFGLLLWGLLPWQTFKVLV